MKRLLCVFGLLFCLSLVYAQSDDDIPLPKSLQTGRAANNIDRKVKFMVGGSFGFQIGDGSLVAVFDDGQAITPTDYDESAPANVTASMCNANASTMFRAFYENKKKLLALYTSTDGLYTSFGSENDFLDYHVIITSQLPGLPDFANVVLKNITKRSRAGTEDDVSFSCVCVKENVAENVDMLKKCIEENKQKAAERKAKLLNK